MASAVIRSFILSINTAYHVPVGAPLATVATPVGQLHELGALLAASQALEGGWNVLYLGPNLPAEEIAAATQAKQSRAVLLSLVYPEGDPGTAAELRRLRQMLGPNIPLVVGGQAAESYTEAIRAVGALVASDFAALGRILAKIRH
jgi:methylmalonyl-CoA mutase cobalamin-binding subunit